LSFADLCLLLLDLHLFLEQGSFLPELGFLECFLGLLEFFVRGCNGWVLLESIRRAAASADS
jgi:hypothetical protein